uniref:Membrane-bound O-acyltransferase C24H6.01c n=1 Tax=Nelumbo nucifera TaxID=4432 RepID=A0A822ZFK0_NELNU|nr:TPA_asm: hypothetical protein HUJ06_002132 [Nelumbo nucifera]
MKSSLKRWEFLLLSLYAFAFYIVIICRSLQLSHEHFRRLSGLRRGWITYRLNDLSDAQWRNFRGNLPVLTVVMAIFTMVANTLKMKCSLKERGMSIIWLFISLCYLSYLHGACIIFILSIASVNFLLVKIFAQYKYFLFVLWSFNISFLLCNRIYEGYPFFIFGRRWAFLDNYRGTFRWHICFNFVVLRMISFGYDYYRACRDYHFDEEERRLPIKKFSFSVYMCYLVYAPLYIAGPIISFNAFASQVLNFMWLKFFLIWRYFRFWSLTAGIEAPENMPKCINNCYDLESFWKNWHASFNKWLVRYMYIPLGGSQKKLLNVWIIFTFVALWHDLEWKLISWAWLTCLFFIPEIVVKSAANAYQVKNAFGEFVHRELRAISGAITITCLMVANLVGYVIGPSGINWLVSRFLQKDGM